MADDAMMVPSEGGSGESAATGSPNLTGALSYLNPEWINEQVFSVASQAYDIINSIIGGLTAPGYGPFEVEITDEMLQKMTPEQFRAYYDTIPSEGAKAELWQRMKDLKLPFGEVLLHEKPSRFPSPEPKLAFTGLDKVPFEGRS